MGGFPFLEVGCFGGWHRLSHAPVTESHIGIHSDGFVMQCDDGWMLWYAQNENNKIYEAAGQDGLKWHFRKVGSHPFNDVEGDLVTAIASRPDLGWAARTYAPWVIRTGDGYRMYFTGMSHLHEENPRSVIGIAESRDGVSWEIRPQCVLEPELPFEENSVSYPSVWQEEDGYHMLYTAGGQDLPSVIGYAFSVDGIAWEKQSEPVLRGTNKYEAWGIGMPCVVREGDWLILAYTTWEDAYKSRICLARSKNGIDGWQYCGENPVLNGGIAGTWDVEGVEVPRLVPSEDGWRLYYTGRRAGMKAIGVVVRDGSLAGREEDWL